MRTPLEFVLFLLLVFESHDPRIFGKKLKLLEMEKNVDFGVNVGGDAHPCYRACNGTAMDCHYNLTLTMFSTLSMHCGDCPRVRAHCDRPGCITAGGTDRPVYVANLMMPGPSIHVCEGDRLTVRVENDFANEGATLHWHGVWMQGSPHMDGVPYVSQCPIQPYNVFEYAFTAYPAGTHMWHSHIGFLEADGLFGPLVVRRAAEPHAALYDEDLPEHTLALWHWYPLLSDDYLPLRLFRNESVAGASILVNGKGVVRSVNGREAPWEEIRVVPGKRYRLRFLYNSAVYCPVQVSVDSHRLLAIASDGANFKPVEVESVMLNAGERWDVVLRADQPVGKYWIRIRALGDCGESKSQVHQQAVLAYEGSNADLPTAPRPEYRTSFRRGQLLNPMQVVVADYSDSPPVHVTDLENIDNSTHGDISREADHTLYLELSFHLYEELTAPGPYPQNNRVTFEYPAVPMILQRYEKADSKKSMCTLADAHEHCIGTYCSCALTEHIALGALVEIVLVDLSTDREQDHPYHIHGTNFHVVAEGTLGANVSVELVRSLNADGRMKKRLSASAPLKDTVTVPSQGYAVIRFRANNPGFWFFHCHVSNHVHLGMALVLQVGEESEMPPVPRNFPRCGDWVFTETEEPSAASWPRPALPLLAALALCRLL
ncbi:Laccase-4 [Frankliniella fusca]|uniref:Laccase-4 n=1 Tax=Frankliniella fusca TaxID=407009 RepID=A0AAE1L9I4_9NEOP|nr:Laccase-4 [Frankliniella fusca]